MKYNINNLFILLHIRCILREEEYNFFVKISQELRLQIYSRLNFYNICIYCKMVKDFRKIQIFHTVVPFSTYRFFPKSVETMLFQYVRKILVPGSRGLTIFRAERN